MQATRCSPEKARHGGNAKHTTGCTPKLPPALRSLAQAAHSRWWARHSRFLAPPMASGERSLGSPLRPRRAPALFPEGEQQGASPSGLMLAREGEQRAHAHACQTCQQPCASGGGAQSCRRIWQACALAPQAASGYRSTSAGWMRVLPEATARGARRRRSTGRIAKRPRICRNLQLDARQKRAPGACQTRENCLPNLPKTCARCADPLGANFLFDTLRQKWCSKGSSPQIQLTSGREVDALSRQ